MKSLTLSIALSLFLALGAAHAASPRRTDAHQLLRLSEAGLADVVHAADATQGRLSRAKAEQRPLWRAVDRMSLALRGVRAGMMARDGSFFLALEEGSAALGELRVVWARTGVPDAGVTEGLRILTESYQLLRTGYGREAVRHRDRRGLTEAERQRFLQIQEAQRRFADLLKQLQEDARRRGDEAMAAELRRMQIDAERIAAAQHTLNAYLNALMLRDAQRGEWTGNAQYAAPGASSQEAETVVEELYTEPEVGHVYALDLGTLPDSGILAADYFDEPTELPESLAEEVAEIDPVEEIEEQEALVDEEMEEDADADLEEIEEILEEEGEDEAVEEEGEVVEEIVLEEGAVLKKAEEKKTEAKADEKTEAKPAEVVDPKKVPKKGSERPPG